MFKAYFTTVGCFLIGGIKVYFIAFQFAEKHTEKKNSSCKSPDFGLYRTTVRFSGPEAKSSGRSIRSR